MTVGGGVALAMFLMRRRVAKKWGLFKSDKKLNGQVSGLRFPAFKRVCLKSDFEAID